MPSIELWQAVKDKDYDKVTGLIKGNSELVNDINADETPLMMRLLALLGAKPQPSLLNLLKFIVNHPKFNIHHQHSQTKETNIGAIISLGNLEVFSYVEEKPEIILYKEKTSYKYAKECLAKATKSYNSELQKDPNSEQTERQRKRVARFNEMVQKLRDLTISHNSKLIVESESADDKLKNTRQEVRLSKSRNVMEMFRDATRDLEVLERAHHKQQADLYSHTAEQIGATI